MTQKSPEQLMSLILDDTTQWEQLRLAVLEAEEETSFSRSQSAILAPRLLDFAIKHRDDEGPTSTTAVWSAIRTGASMLYPDNIRLLVPLLEPGHKIETVMVTMKMIGRIFEAQPPLGLDLYPDVALQISNIIKLLLNKYVLISTQSAALAELSICALVSMGSNEAPPFATLIRNLNLVWFSGLIKRELKDLEVNWLNNCKRKVDSECQRILHNFIQEI